MKRLIVLLVILLLLAAAVFVVQKPRIEQERRIREGASSAPNLFPSLDVDKVNKIFIDDGIDKRTLEKTGDGWLVSSDGAKFFPADKTKVDEVLDCMKQDLTEDNVASSLKEKHAQFEVDEKTGTQVAVYAGGEEPAAKFIIGKQGPDYSSTFVRKDGDDRTFLIARQLSAVFNRDLNGWRDKHVMKFDPALVTEAYFDFDGQKYRVKKEDKGWMLLEPEESPANGIKIEAELKSLSELEATGFEDKPIEEAGLSKPASEVLLTFADGTKLRALFAAEDAGYVNAYIEGKSDTIFKIGSVSFSPLKITALSQLKMEEKQEEAASSESGGEAEGKSADSEKSGANGGGDAEKPGG
ncbi:MAG: DUF4340 domain-containing protein [bacterium]|jgi:hypothetical protein